jgi:hypothetical protein
MLYTSLVIVLAIVLSGCGVGSGPTLTPPEMSTSAAQTVQAILNTTPLASPEAQTQVPQTLVPLASATPQIATATPTLEAPKLTVEDVTNCRKGPGSDYERLTQITAGQQVSIIGSFPEYWLVQSGEGLCWIAMEFSTPSGNLTAVPTVNAPTAQSAGKPDAPVLQEWTYSCTGDGHAELLIRWTDKADNESGYRVYMNGEVLTELPSNSNRLETRILLPTGLNASIYVEAFNQSGSASFAPFTFSC